MAKTNERAQTAEKDKNDYVTLAQDIKNVASSLKEMDDAFGGISTYVSEIVGLGSELIGTADLIKAGFTGSNGLAAVIGFGLSSLIKFATDQIDLAQKEYEANIKYLNEGAESLSREGYSFNPETQAVVDMVKEAKKGHAPMDKSSLAEGAGIAAIMGSGEYKTDDMDMFLRNAGLAYEYQYNIYLEELDSAIQVALKRETAAMDSFNEAIANGASEKDAVHTYNEAMLHSSEQLTQDVNNAQKTYNVEMMKLTHGILTSMKFEMSDVMKDSMQTILQGYNEGDFLSVNAAWDVRKELKGTDAERLLQFVNDKGYFEAMGITNENKSLNGNLIGYGRRNNAELAAMFMSFFGGVDPNTTQYGDVEGTYQYNSAAKTAETLQPTDTVPTGTINYQEITSPADMANYLFASMPTDSEAYAGMSSGMAAILPQAFSSEDFGASLTTALTTAFASEDLWRTLGETISSGLAAMVEGQREAFGEYGTGLGEAMTAGVAQGIDSGTARVCNSIRIMANRAVMEARKRLDIHSPSRVFRQIGLYTGEGFALGIDESLLLAENAAMRMAEGVARTGAGTNAAGGRGTVVNLNVNQPSIRSDDDVRRLSQEFARYTAAMTYGL